MLRPSALAVFIELERPTQCVCLPRKVNRTGICWCLRDLLKCAIQEPIMLDVSKPKTYNTYDAPHQDLREFVARIEASGELLRVPGAHWDLEMGALAEIVCHTRPEPPAILFEDVPGYPRGMRLLSGATRACLHSVFEAGFPLI
jgi:hypothetical protein